MGESMVKYTKKSWWKKSSLKREKKFTKTQESIFRFYLNLILKLSIGFIINQLQIFLNFGIIKAGNKYVWNWLVNVVFKPIFSLKILMKCTCKNL